MCASIATHLNPFTDWLFNMLRICGIFTAALPADTAVPSVRERSSVRGEGAVAVTVDAVAAVVTAAGDSVAEHGKACSDERSAGTAASSNSLL